ncbi:MAG: DNA-deoxyinosine glycosylase [Defluviitaleaceae bacterium]|nr:DNA-deoxyinosine glycosylase [Defluviitaleaceae bacterium]
MMNKSVVHTVKPIYDERSKVLILGTMLSPKSREVGFYYSHPQNRFWRTIAEVVGAELPVTIEEKIHLLHANRIALWDVLASCQISGADDNSIKDAVVNDFTHLFETADIQAVFTTGKKSTDLFKKHCEAKYGFTPIYLPSTSPANCKMSQQELTAAYKIIADILQT